MNKKVLRSLEVTPHRFIIIGSKTNNFIEEDYCGLISVFFIDLFHRNTMINDSLQLFHNPLSETEVAFFIEQCLSFVYSFYCSDRKRWWIFFM